MNANDRKVIEECRYACILHRQVIWEANLKGGRLCKGDCTDLIDSIWLTTEKMRILLKPK